VCEPSAVSNMRAERLLEVAGLSCDRVERRWWGGIRSSRPVIRDVSFTLDAGRTLALVGPSGSGKTTLARCIAGMEKPDRGTVRVAGAVQLIPQQPAASLNPRFTAAEIVEEPLVIRRSGTRRERRRRVLAAMESVGVDPAACGKRALAFSGGERQRLAIARALVTEPTLLILDESLASLDLSIQAQIANLLVELQERLGLGYIVISHDLTTVSRIATEIAVMDGGRLVEFGPAAEVLEAPREAVTRELVAAGQALTL
jgi:peptide/nickel transport system ATP-binding protein